MGASFVLWLLVAACLVTFVVLLLGLGALMRGRGPERSQKFMRLRVVSQLVALLLVLGVLLLLGAR